MGAQATTDYRRRRKENLIRVCGSKCALCGYNKIPSALEFHHIDPNQKTYGIGANGICHDLEKDLAEIKKCLLVCANCHREIHNDFYSEKELWEKQIFDENYANHLRESKISQEYFCKECGVKITRYSSSGLCSECAHKARRTTERPSREDLKFLIRTKPFTQIGVQYGVSDNSIRKWCKAEGLPTKASDIRNYTDQEWEKI